ncbi:MAG: hypothetical protein KF774_18705 [Planctomyces sp.]|nr:hypothetical protein [Planctomyces sp.]
MDTADTRRRLQKLQQEVSELERVIAREETTADWPPRGFYSAYYATTGFLLGGAGALASLLANVFAAPLAGKSPLELIKVYLTFPFGARALDMQTGGGLILALGCTLYIATGMLLGVPMYWVMARVLGRSAGLGKRLIVASVLALALYAINFHVLLSWLQPLLIGGNWITDPTILPPWVAAATHLVFGWTLAVLYPLGQFTPYQPPRVAPPG